MKISEVREKTTDELQSLEGDMRRQLWKARFDNQTNQLDDTASIVKLRRNIAKVKTVLTERRASAGASQE